MVCTSINIRYEEKGAGIGKIKMNFYPTWDCAIEYLAFIALPETKVIRFKICIV